MDSQCKRIRDDILSDMKQIRQTLRSSATIVRGQKGVGCEFCADKLEEIANRYSGYITTIGNMN